MPTLPGSEVPGLGGSEKWEQDNYNSNAPHPKVFTPLGCYWGTFFTHFSGDGSEAESWPCEVLDVGPQNCGRLQGVLSPWFCLRRCWL